LAHFLVVQDHGGDPGSVLRGGGVVSADQDLDLGEHALGGRDIGANNVQSASAFTVETHNLGKGLSDDHFEATGNEVAETVGVVVEAAGGETLVGRVEEGVELVLLANISDHGPLLLGGVHTGGIVSAGVKKDSRTGRGGSEIPDHTLNIETLGAGLEVGVFTDLDTGRCEDSFVVTPGGLANIEGARAELPHELGNYAESASAGESLGGDDATGSHIGVVPAK
jgi:hypothetical protein